MAARRQFGPGQPDAHGVFRAKDLQTHASTRAQGVLNVTDQPVGDIRTGGFVSGRTPAAISKKLLCDFSTVTPVCCTSLGRRDSAC
ncbi:hypothetical protein ACLK2I_07090 [Escherichia coli]